MVRKAAIVSLLFLIGSVARPQGDKAEPIQRLGKAELEKLAGHWEHVFDTKGGYTGSLLAKCKVVEGRDKTFFLSVQYACTARRGDEEFVIENTNPTQLGMFAQGKKTYLVVNSDLNAKKNQVTFGLEGNTLTLGAAESYKSLVPLRPIHDLDLTWGELKLRRVKE